MERRAEAPCNIFLKYASVFEQAMLPHLAAVDVFRLACVSKGLHQWLLNIAPQRWQVCLGLLPAQPVSDCAGQRLDGGLRETVRLLQATTDVSTAYLHQLSSTAEVLEALRKAHTAKCNILAGRAPAEHEVTEMFTMTESPSQQPWIQPLVPQLLISSCGQYLAVAVQGYAVPDSQQRPRLGRPWDMHDSVTDVLIYSTSESMQQQACLAYGCHQPVLHWAPDVPHLTIASFAVPAREGKHGSPSQLPGVLVWDAAAAAIVHSVCADLLGVLGGVRSWHWFWDQACFCPSGRSLLVTRVKLVGSHDSGMLSVIDVHGGKLLAQTGYTGPGLSPEYARWPAIWRPDSQGLVLEAGVLLKEASGFSAAGIALTRLPEHCMLKNLEGIGFSTDGQYCLTRAEHDEHWSVLCNNQYRLCKLYKSGDHLALIMCCHSWQMRCSGCPTASLQLLTMIPSLPPVCSMRTISCCQMRTVGPLISWICQARGWWRCNQKAIALKSFCKVPWCFLHQVDFWQRALIPASWTASRMLYMIWYQRLL